MNVREHRLLYGIPVMIVPGRKLEMPAELSGQSVQSHDTVRIEVVAGSLTAFEDGCRVADAPVQEVQFRVVRPGCPRWRSTGPPGVTRPGIVSRLPRARHGIELPQKFSVASTVRRDEPTDAEVSAGNANNDAVAQSERRPRHRVILPKIGDFGLPLSFPR